MYYAPGIISIIAHQFTYWDSIKAGGSHFSRVTQKPLSTDRNHVSRGKVSNFQNACFYVKWQTVTLSPTHHHFGDDNNQIKCSPSILTLGDQQEIPRLSVSQWPSCWETLRKLWTAHYETPRTCLNGWVKLLGPGTAESGFFFFFAWCWYFCYYRGETDTKPHARQTCQFAKVNMKMMDITAQHSPIDESSTERQRDGLVFWHQPEWKTVTVKAHGNSLLANLPLRCTKSEQTATFHL